MSGVTGVKVVVDNTQKVLSGLRELARSRVMVGIPSDKAGRKEGEITNAALGYIHENGAPEVNVPARPHLLPGVRAVQDSSTIPGLRLALVYALDGRPEAVGRQLHRVGLRASISVKATINAGVPPPLAVSTLRRRAARGRKGAAKELANRAAGLAASTQLAKPLIDTAQLRNAYTYVVRKV